MLNFSGINWKWKLLTIPCTNLKSEWYNCFPIKTIYFWLYFDSSVVKYLLFLSSFMKMPIVLHISSVLFSIVGNFSHDDTGAYFFNWATPSNSSLTILQLIFEMHLFSFRKNIESLILRTKYAATLPNCHLFKWIAIVGVISCEDKFHLNPNFGPHNVGPTCWITFTN